MYLFKPRPGEQPKDHKFYRSLYPQIIQDIEVGVSVLSGTGIKWYITTLMGIFFSICSIM